ncbi:MAG: Hsp70 family protein, partial [Kiritimatiellia bacterium]
LDGIPPAPRGIPQIEVAFDIDANGILHVSAKDLGTGKEQKITITSSSGLDKSEIDRLVNDAEQHATEDQRKRDEVETRNRADATVYETEKFLKENGDKVDATRKAALEAAVERLKQAVKDGGADAIKSGMEDLNKEMQAVSSELYAKAKQDAGAAQAEPAQEPPPPEGAQEAGGSKKDDGVIDADFEMVDDKK